MKAFIAAVVCAIAITVVANVVLEETVPLSAEQAYTTGDHVRLGQIE